MNEETISLIRETYRDRVDFMREEKSLTLRIKARCRRLCSGDKEEAQRLYDAMMKGEGHELAVTAYAANEVFLSTRESLSKHRKAMEKRLEALARSLPVATFVEGINGMGYLGLAIIIGEATNYDHEGERWRSIGDYPNPAKLWKRMGLAVNTEGVAQGWSLDKEGNRSRATGALALEDAYNRERRSAMYTIGDSLIKKQNAYRDLYLERKAYEQSKAPESRPIVHHRRAQRYMEKALLKDLWQAWHSTDRELVAV